MKRALTVSIAVLLVLTACGDDDDGSSDGGASEETVSTSVDGDEPEVTTAETDPRPQTTEDDSAAVDTTSTDGAESPWCGVARDLNEAFRLDSAQSGTPDGIEDAFTELAEVLDTAEAAAPPEISEQVVALGDAIDAITEAFVNVEWNPSAISDEVGEELSAPIETAFRDITEFNEELCGLTSEAACNAMNQTLEVAVEAFIASEGRPPVDEQELIDAGFIREDIEGFDLVDGEIVATAGGGC